MLKVKSIILGYLLLLTPYALADTSFIEDYRVWIDPKNSFVVEVSETELRPLYAYGDFSSNEDNTARLGTGLNPTVSEGLGYALLLSYAANDQESFDKFLRFAWNAAIDYGCRGQNHAQAPCEEPVFLVPWMINEEGQPFMTTGTGAMDGNASVNYSSGSASDADFQIAWAVHLAAENWEVIDPNLNYTDIYTSMMWDIAKFDINLTQTANKNLYLPGASWYEEGEKTFFTGYYTPQSFDIFAQYTRENLPEKTASLTAALSEMLAATDIQIKFKNTTSKVAIVHDSASGNGSWKTEKPTNIPGHSEGTYVFAGNAGAWLYLGWQQGGATPTALCAETFALSGTTWKANGATQIECNLIKVQNNVFEFSMYNPTVEDWIAVKEDNLAKIVAFQHQYSHLSGLLPNIADPNTMQTKYNDHYGYDATRYPLWTGAYLLTQCDSQNAEFCGKAYESLSDLSAFFVKNGVIEAGSLPVEGYYYGPQSKQVAVSGLAGPALNGPALVAAIATDNTALANALSPRFNEYQLAEHTPTPEVPYNSSAYYEGALLMLSKAALEKKL